MDAEKDYNLLSEIMHNANIGWWKADIQDADLYTTVPSPAC